MPGVSRGDIDHTACPGRPCTPRECCSRPIHAPPSAPLTPTLHQPYRRQDVYFIRALVLRYCPGTGAGRSSLTRRPREHCRAFPIVQKPHHLLSLSGRDGRGRGCHPQNSTGRRSVRKIEASMQRRETSNSRGRKCLRGNVRNCAISRRRTRRQHIDALRMAGRISAPIGAPFLLPCVLILNRPDLANAGVPRMWYSGPVVAVNRAG
jgi:hypothetical protein